MATPRVLIVENEQIVAEDIRECLSGFGYEVVDNVGNGEKALQVAEKTLPDLVLMDINLDGDLDGTQVAQKLRNLYGIPVIYLTGYADDQTLKKAKSTVPLGFILKPFDERELRSAIEIALYRKEFEKNLVADSEWRKNAIESFDDGVIATDKNNCIKFMNCAAERITGWFFIEAHEKPLGNIFSVKRSDVSKIITKNGDVKHSNQKNSIRISNLQLIQSDGISEVTVNIIAHPILGPSDEWMGFTIIIRDVGIRKDQTENVLGLQQKELLHEKMEALHDLVEGLAHGINNSLCGSVGFLELLRQNGQIEEEFARWADMAISGCQNASALINKVRGYCQTSPQDPKRLDLNEVVSGVLGQLASSIGRDIKIQYTRSNSQIWIMGDRAQLEQAIVNVLINAAIALEGKGEIEIHNIRENILEHSTSLGNETITNYGVVSIKDSGTGISPEVITRIFDPFYTTIRDGKVLGKGLGLSLAYGIMCGHGGWINVESTKGEGSTFRLYLPLVK